MYSCFLFPCSQTHIFFSYGYTPLHVAAKNGNAELCKLLIDYGANVNAVTPSKMTPLHISVLENHVHIVQLLLENNANVHLREEGNRETPILLACSLGHTKIIQLLEERDANIEDVDENGNNGFMLACENGHVETIRYLLQSGHSPNCRNKFNSWTPLHFAASQGHVEIAKLLIQYKCDINARDDVGRTALHYASAKGHADVVELLILSGIDTEIVDDGSQYGTGEGKTALDLAVESIHYHKVTKTFRESLKRRNLKL